MTKFLKTKDSVDKIFAVITKIAQVIAAVFLCIMIVDVTVQVVGRICHFKIPVTEEIGTYSLIWMTYIASIAVTIRGEHLTVDLLLNRYTPAQRRVVRLITDLIILIFCGMLMVFGFMLCGNPIIINGRTPALQMSRLFVYMSVPIAMTFNTLFMLYDLVVAVADIRFHGGVTDVENQRKAEEEAKHAEERAQEEAEFKKAFLVQENNGEEENK